ncbi:MAG TPA: NAD-dependent epimerase/dehydratase family protein [Gammaproteobacteria bacterium]|nr:NAD-dependent epimerase/dehydratase family protein [Gammaproteobacteria bacterium]
MTLTDNARIVVTGGAGFLGSHLSRSLINHGHRVLAFDNLHTGREENIDDLRENPRFSLVNSNVTDPNSLASIKQVNAIAHLAFPASPTVYTRSPIDTLWLGSLGMFNVLDLAHKCNARLVYVSSSGVYGDPLVSPQEEDYRGNVDPVGPNCAHDEAKRFGEAVAATYRRNKGVNVGIVRPFNIYGPNMWPDDGRVVASFCAAALRGETLNVYNGGTQTRTLLYVDDAVDGLERALASDEFGPINLGSSEEFTIRRLAELVVKLAGSGRVAVTPGKGRDTATRRADTTRARVLLNWTENTPLEEGLARTVMWMRQHVTVGGSSQ